MTEPKFIANMYLLGEGIGICLKNGLQIPALVLLYSAIDVVAWLACDDPKAIPKDRFMAWVEDYVLPGSSLTCSALDLYSARCGLLHTLTPDSHLSNMGEARIVSYYWGTGDHSVIQQTIDASGEPDSHVAVRIEDLHMAWRRGVSAFWGDVRADPARRVRVYGRASNFYYEIRVSKEDP